MKAASGQTDDAGSTPHLALSSASGTSVAQLPSSNASASPNQIGLGGAAPAPSTAAADQHRWAKLIGIIFMPPLVAIGTLVVLSAYLVADPLVAARTALVSALFMAIIPTGYIGWLIRRQRIRGGIELVITEERLRPYLVCTLSCAIGTVVLIRLSAPQHIWALALGYVLLGVLMAAITQHWKISMHAAGSALPTTALLSVLGPTALPGILIVPLVCWARVRASQHTVPQVAGGTLLGSLVAWLDFALILPRL